ncbi:D-alanyl-D-alanine carboxypeptidase [Crossiella equi]|uniref:D-alanyl-D-alanine carboxypeptidase n=1 Tax=Crossiella equi TaxID=130796 RepID=A0ABS5ARH9_9PSEU|nr:serine hydrolase domain-containing protein [Crossiella equi]MBP2479160.1 D-alanyl-D-alanine carboxypeptidase [Crossiella equi]
MKRTLAATITVGLALVCTGAGAVAAPKDPVRASLEGLVHNDKFPAALATVDGRHLVAGQAPRNGKVRIGSNTKAFVATAVLQLVGEGKVKLDEPIETYLPGLVRGEGIDGRNITVRQVLQHTSGLPNYTKYLGIEGFGEVRDRYVSPRETLDAGLAHPADFAPGTQWSYSNTGYTVAGLIIQKVTGRPVSEVVTERVIKKAGLRDTYWPNVGERTLRGTHARGYERNVASDPASVVDATVMDAGWGWAAGELVGTPEDLNRFYRALLGGKLLRPVELAEMKRTVPAPGLFAGATYGLGLMRVELGCGKVMWGHGGDIPGYETRGGVTEDGREAALAVTALPGTFGDAQTAHQHVLAAVETMLCR